MELRTPVCKRHLARAAFGRQPLPRTLEAVGELAGQWSVCVAGRIRGGPGIRAAGFPDLQPGRQRGHCKAGRKVPDRPWLQVGAPVIPRMRFVKKPARPRASAVHLQVDHSAI